MKITAFAGREGLWGGLVSLVLGLGTVSVCGSAAPMGAPDASAISRGATNTADLEYAVAPQPLITWALRVDAVPKPFQREPDTAGRKVCRGTFQFGDVAAEQTAFLWDYTKGQLYLDLNHNRDLTDDPKGALSCPGFRFNYYFQSFTNAHLRVKTLRGLYPVCVDLNFYNPSAGHPSANAGCRSFWSGIATLGGRDYQVGRVDTSSGQLAMETQGSLLLRPWEQRDQSWDLMNGSLAAFGYSPNLFFSGQAYRVDCAYIEQGGTPKFRITFRDKEAELGELKLTGNCIERLVLTPKPGGGNRAGSPFTAVLDRPEGLVKIPVGEYQQWRVFLKAGTFSAYNETRYPNSQGLIKVATNGATSVLAAGAPLTNSVLASGQGRQLALNYRLLGGAGATFQLTTGGVREPPRFAIYKNGHTIHTGRFEFG